jgi:hypothetical protein
MVPRSGQVAITTSTPASRSRRTAWPSSRTDVLIVTLWVTSLAPMKMTATCGSVGSTWSI